MEIRVLIVSLACLSCLVPPALASGLVAKAAALGAVKGAVLGGIKGAAVGAGVGLAAKGAAALIAKKALLGLLLKGAALKGAAILAAKKAAIKGIGALAVKGLNGVMSANGIVSALTDTMRSGCPPTFVTSPLLQILSGTVRTLQTALQPCEVAQERAPVVYRVIKAPRIFAVPV